MTDTWGWESPKDRLKRYSRIPAKRKMEALEEMRQFVLKYGLKNKTVAQKAG